MGFKIASEPRNARRVAELIKLYINVSLGDRVIPIVRHVEPKLTMNETVRPEFLSAIQDGWWSRWFLLAYLAPFVLILPACRVRWIGCAISPIAFFVFFVLYFAGVRVYDQAFFDNAVTDAEWNMVSADTGRVFMPFFWGIPRGLLTTGLALLIGQIIHPMVRLTPAPRLESNEQKFLRLHPNRIEFTDTDESPTTT